MKRTQGITEYFLSLRKRLSKWNKVIVALAAVVVFATTYALILPAATLNKDAASQDPAINLDQEMQDFNPKLQAKTKDGDYTVGITYGDDAGIPDGAKLKVAKLGKSSADYKSAKEAVVKSRKEAAKKQSQTFNEGDLGLAALDISIVDANGNKIEPKSKVDVKVAMKDLPDAAMRSGVAVRHIVSKGENKQSDKAAQKEDSDSKGASSELAAVAVKGKTNVNPEGRGTAEFAVDSFSVFTITWTKGTTGEGSSTRIGSVKVRYVDSGGLELDTTEAFDTTELGKMAQTNGGIVDLSTWANKNGSSRISGYTYDHATIGSRNGKIITGVKVATATNEQQAGSGEGQNVTVTEYRLYYTTDDTVSEGSKWTLYKDSSSDAFANNANVFLAYKNIKKPVTIHFLDTDGNAIKESDGGDLAKVIDATDHTTEYDLVTFAKANTPAGYSFSDSNMNSDYAGTNKIILGESTGSVTIGGVRGTYYRFLKYEDGSVKLRRGNTDLQAVSDPVDIYITFTKTNNPTAVTIHHVDKYGARLAPDTDDAFGFATGNFTNRWNGSSKNSSSGQSYFQQKAVSGVGTYKESYIGVLNSQSNLGDGGLFYKKDSSTGLWHTGTGAMSSGGASVTTEIKKDDSPVLYTDIYNVYTGKKGLTIHYVDENGKELRSTDGTAVDNGGTFTAGSSAPSISGYTYKGAHLGSASGSSFTDIAYTQNGDDWTSAVKNGGQEVGAQSPVNEVWLVYTNNSTKSLTVHYKYINKSGTYSDAFYGSSEDNKTESLTINKEQQYNYLSRDANDNFVPAVHDRDVWRPAGDGESDKQPLIFMSTHLASEDGPVVNSVSIGSDGSLIYHTSMTGTATSAGNLSDPTSWTLSQPLGAQRGRSIVISKGNDDNLMLRDTQNGEMNLNLVSENGGDASQEGARYKTTFHNENYTVDYTVTLKYSSHQDSDGVVTRIPEYEVQVLDSYASTSTDVYQVYVDGSDDTDKLWVEDDMKYSGLFRTDASASLRKKLETAENVTYEWHRIVVGPNGTIPSEITDSTDQSSYEVVRRKQSGEHWNIALDQKEATWLDIEADEGNEIWTAANKRAYYVKLTYTPKGSSTPETIYSTPLTVNYYGQLENGSFETPVKGNGDFSNASYRAAGGVWQTTGPGSTRGKDGQDIEIVSGTDHNTLRNSYNWQATDEELANSNGSWAADGNQFAELNAENAGALYQDVITHPNENINFWLSHRARGGSEANMDKYQYYYDTMYVVLMPTKLAMTLGDNNTELRTQSELQKFIEAHGGFDTSMVKGHRDGSAEQAELRYHDEDTGIMIYKVRSDEFGWHYVSVVNQYAAKGGLTRFFFCAASTAGDKARGEEHKEHADDPPTMGNFLDNVGFNQGLPPTRGFHLTVTETFSGLTTEQLAGLANNAADYSSNGIVEQPQPLRVTLTNTRTGSGGTGANDALNGATLGLTAGYDNDNNLVLTPTANKDGTDLFDPTKTGQPGSGDVHRYPDGRIVITWMFPDQLLSESTGESSDQTYKYVATDNITNGSQTVSTTDVGGFTKTTSQNVIDNSESTTTSFSTSGQVDTDITKGSDKSLNIINAYSPNVHISVEKTFAGVTPSTVSSMMGNYRITVSKDSSATKVLKVDGGYQSDGTTKDSTVTVSHATNEDGSTTYKWVITDPNWQNATYTVKEENYTTNSNALKGIKLNGESVLSDGSWPAADRTVMVNDSTTAQMSFKSTSSQQNNGVVDLSGYGGKIEDAPITTTNLVVGQYTLNTTSASEEGESTPTATTSTKKYLVWTSEPVGLTTRRAIIKEINDIWGETVEANKATSQNTSFFSGDDAYIVSDGRVARMTGRQSASLTGLGEDDKWDKFYAAEMTADSDGSSVDESEIRIENEYAPKIKIQKQSSSEQETLDNTGAQINKRLNGAQFRLYKKGSGSTKLYLQNTGDTGTESWVSNTENAQTFTTRTTGDLGDGIAVLDTLPASDNTTYYLEEAKAPDGYNKIGDIAFKIRSNGTVILTGGGAGTQTSGVQLSFIDPYYTFIIDDDPGIVLPSTGGPGDSVLLVLAGLALVAMAAGCAVMWRRRPAGRHGL